ncbi:CinA family protein [Cellvibrio fontiphilus]|uniref:CinA family protein n=1 Tax=Cellvibrio fontiphilus TaxID=1815559 RepID=A0ABV7FGF2_9GAMM
MNNPLAALAQSLGDELSRKGWRIATAESCTGGGVAAAITAIAGSSAWFEYGVVTYANTAKQKLLGVKTETLDTEGAVSEAVVAEMALGALALSGADLAVAISGIAGPGGATPGKPVGTVWFAWATANGDLNTAVQHIDGDRAEVQCGAVIYALQGALAICRKNTV